MTDIGFGLVDRRTVIIIIFVMVIAQAVFGLKIPIDASNAGQLFIDLVILTGYFYLARTVFRLPFAVLAGISLPLQDLTERVLRQARSRNRKRRGETPSEEGMGDAAPILAHRGSFPLGEHAFFFLAFTLTPAAWKSSEFTYSWLLNLIDRLGLVGCAVVATVPLLNQYVVYTGLAGLILITVLYVVSGGFTWLLEDAVLRGEQEHDELVQAINNSARISGEVSIKKEYSDYD